MTRLWWFHCFYAFFPDTNMVWGGAPKPHAIAQEHSWKRILDHFHTHLTPT